MLAPITQAHRVTNIWVHISSDRLWFVFFASVVLVDLEDICSSDQLETLLMPLFHTCFVALNEQHARAEASSEAIVGLSLFDTSQKTSGLIICCPFFFRPIVGGDKRKRASDRRKSLSITLFPRCLTGRQRGGRGGADGAEEAICSVAGRGAR